MLADVGEEVVVERRRHTQLLPPAPRLLHRRGGGGVARAHEAHEACQLDLGVPKLRETRGSGETGSGKKRYPTDARREAALRRVAVERQISAWILRKAPIFAKHP